MTTIQERRLAEVNRKIDRLYGRRDAALGVLVRVETELRELLSKRRRYERLAAAAKPKPVDKPAAVSAPVAMGQMGQAEMSRNVPNVPIDTSVPDWLARKREGDAKDAAAREAILAEEKARSRGKALARVGKMKAKQSGEARRMPLTGKAALAAIRNQ